MKPKDDVEELVELELQGRMQRAQETERSDLSILTGEIRNFAEVVSKAVVQPSEVIVAAPVVQPQVVNADVSEVLREMKKFNSAVVTILSRPDVPQANMNIPNAPPNVQVQAPSVTVTPNIRVEQPPARRYRITVETRDNTAQQRAKTFLIEPLD